MEKITISIDAMGGTNAPAAVIEAISIMCHRYRNIYFLIFGEETSVLSLLESFKVPQDSYAFIPTESVILDNDKPIYALKYGRNSSMRKAIDSVKEEKAMACVSCGNTGALMVTAKMVLGCLPGVKRPAIAGLFPHISGRSVMLDMGANNECTEVNLFQFAVMGLSFAKILLHKEDPSVAILNIGKEEVKGRDLEQKTFELLKDSGLNFIGYIEGNDITQGKTDVIVTDGFSGNLVLKASEGAAHIFLYLIKEACRNTMLSRLGAWLLKGALKSSLKSVDPNINNGAMFIGLNGIVIKSHGSATVQGIANAIHTAFELVELDINQQIIAELKYLEEKGVGLNLVEKIKHTSARIFGL